MNIFRRSQKKKPYALSLRNTVRELRLFKNRLIITACIILLLAFSLLARLFYLQITQHRYYATLSMANQINLVPIPPQRGLIYDRNGILLARNIPVFSLMVTPDKTINLQEELKQLNAIIPISDTELKEFNRQAREHRRFQQIPLKIKLSELQIAVFSVNRYRFPGFSVEANLVRDYPYGEAFAHVLGYVGRINVEELQTLDPSNYAETNYMGKTGVEKSYEDVLHGTVGYQKVETDASGEVVRTLGVVPPKAGKDLYLTIDSSLQITAENALNGAKGAIVAMDPNTGEILAMVSEPSFDPNIFVQGISQQDYSTLAQDPSHPLYNRTIRGLYAMGSTIKPFIGLEALDIGATNPNYKIFDQGWFKIPNYSHIFHDWKKGGHGWVNLHTAIAQSCDTYFFNLAYNMGITPIENVLTQFGFGQKTGVDLPGELAGNVPSPTYKKRATGERWYKGDTVNSVIGQGFSQVTPLQLATATSIMAARGIRHQPYLLYATQLGQQKIIQQPSQILAPIQLAHPENWGIILEAMEAVVKEGTGHGYGQTTYTVAAKTGTAQVRSIYIPEGQKAANEAETPHSIFIAFAPADKPQIAVAVIVEHSPGAAVIVARKVIDAYLLTEKHLSMPGL